METYDEYALDELIHQYMDDEIELDEIVEFCDNLEPSSENKKMLIDCIDCYDIEVLYETLFDRFSNLLSDEEKIKYRERFSKTFARTLTLNDNHNVEVVVADVTEPMSSFQIVTGSTVTSDVFY